MAQSPTPDFLSQLDAIDVDAASVFALPKAQLMRTVGPGHWSALQCFEHLTLMNRLYMDVLNPVIRDARARAALATHPFHYTLAARIVIRLVEPPPALKVPIPTQEVSPPATADVDAVRSAYDAHHHDLRQMIVDALQVDLRTTLRNPFVRAVTMQLGSIIGVMLAHERRHIYQAKKAAGVFVA